MKTGKRIKDLRIQKGMTQEELAEKTELSVRTIQRIEHGEVDPRSYTLQMIANALDVEYSFLMEGETETDAKNETRHLAWLHFSGLFLLFIPTILIWNQHKSRTKNITAHFHDVMEFQLTIWVLFLFPGLVMYYYFSINQFINNAPFFIAAGIVIDLVFSVMNTILVLNDKPYRRFNILNWKKETNYPK